MIRTRCTETRECNEGNWCNDLLDVWWGVANSSLSGNVGAARCTWESQELVLRQEFWGLEGLNGQSPEMTLINRLDILCIYIIICACVCVFRLWKHLGPQLNTFGSFFHWLIDSYQRPHLNNHYIHQRPKWIPFVVPWLYLTLKPPSNQVDGSSLFTPVQQPWARPDVKPKERGRRLAGP
jgi:hypothetical protein